LNAAALASGRPISSPPRTTAIGALAYYVSHADPAHYDPTNITFGIIEPLTGGPRNKTARKLALSARALADLRQWMDGQQLPVADTHGLETSPPGADIAAHSLQAADHSRI
jgi:folate-dependent tRNA-U54 methylase TrmFO/GidA